MVAGLIRSNKQVMALNPASASEARALLVQLGAPPQLVQHGKLVGEAAEILLERLLRLHVPIHGDLVRCGVVLHDAGKILHPTELARPGSEHEPDGERLLRDHGVSPEVARICLSHARWASMEVSLDELVVALSDKLWKGVRHQELEERVIHRVADALGKQPWDLFVELDTLFEEIAAGGARRLERSIA